ncbi:unnamed protein product [Prunus armeniaca]
MMMTVFITEDPSRSIDVYLRSLVDELKDLWTNGVRTYDKATGKMFTLRVAVMWTVNDFPAYAMVSGWSTKGYMACPICNEDVTSDWHTGKVCYLGHRRWFPWDHKWRKKDKEFDRNTEHRLRPREWSGDEILERLNRLDFSPFGKTVARTRPSTHLNWTHKDGDKARRDLTFFSMKPNDKKYFLKFVSSVKFPDVYASNIARCVNVDGDIHQFEMIFPPAFFTSMIHVMVHLPEEALLAGPVNYCWMYPIERLLGELKKTVRNGAKPEGSIIEAWVQYESLTFYGMYLKDVDTVFNRPQRNNDGGLRNEKLSVFA